MLAPLELLRMPVLPLILWLSQALHYAPSEVFFPPWIRPHRTCSIRQHDDVMASSSSPGITLLQAVNSESTSEPILGCLPLLDACASTVPPASTNSSGTRLNPCLTC